MEKTAEYGCSPFSRLPDDIVVQIYNKVMDLKTLCRCQLISKRLGLLVFQADTILFSFVPLRNDYENYDRLDEVNILFELYRSGALDSDPAPLLGSESFPAAIKFVKRFTKLKSICIQFPSYVNVMFGVSFFQIRMELTGTRGDWFGIHTQKSEDVSDEEEEEEEEEEFEEEEEDEEEEEEEEEERSDDEDTDEYEFAKERASVQEDYCSCLIYVVDRFKKVLGCTVEFPLLEKVFIMDSRESGIATLSGGEIDKLRNLLHSCGTI